TIRTGLRVPIEGMTVMRLLSVRLPSVRLPARLRRVAVLLPASLLLATGAGAAAQDTHAHEHADAGASASAPSAAMRTVRWSDPAAWPGGKVPGAGDAVTIGPDMDVVLDVDPPALRSVTIDGKLRFADDSDIALETEWIYLRRGELRIGSEARPYTHKATITLTDTVP